MFYNRNYLFLARKLLTAVQSWIFLHELDKVHIFWEGHKILQNLHLTFVLCSARVRWRFRKILWPFQNIWTLLSKMCVDQFFSMTAIYREKCWKVCLGHGVKSGTLNYRLLKVARKLYYIHTLQILLVYNRSEKEISM